MFVTGKQFKGNLALKIDIRKAFDTLGWSFLLKVLRQFDFSDIFCYLIDIIFHSAKLSAFVNGKSVGYFSCVRGVRQRDPLSLLLFRLAEEVLSRSITRAKVLRQFGFSDIILHSAKLFVLVNGKYVGYFSCVRGVCQGGPLSQLIFCLELEVLSRSITRSKVDGSLSAMLYCRDIEVPTHVLYADDILFFVLNPAKRNIFPGCISHARLLNISALLGFHGGLFLSLILVSPSLLVNQEFYISKPLSIKLRLSLQLGRAPFFRSWEEFNW
ncbi:unnamed protein product [Trifolium pratense]|uniref:Uncharacterized protein n=1 Tax=Trifolium pratense TaxID=57577 RepID=A0ACB0LPX9_TRIPR|nr:unnamed protein product [Trifolium pratense]